MEDNIHEEDVIDIGVPNIRWLHQSRSIKQAMIEFSKKKAEMRAAGGDPDDEVITAAMEDAKTRMERLMRKEGLHSLGDALGTGISEEE